MRAARFVVAVLTEFIAESDPIVYLFRPAMIAMMSTGIKDLWLISVVVPILESNRWLAAENENLLPSFKC